MTGGSNMDITPKIDMHGFIHFTGGGWRKISSTIFGTELSAVIDTPIQPPKIMSFLQKLGGISDSTAYGSWHMGQGGAVIVGENNVQTIIDTATKHNVKAQPIGYLHKTSSTPTIKIISAGANQNGKRLVFQVVE
jgi:phosphoribosylaminoimidazole (AIR) synthetase